MSSRSQELAQSFKQANDDFINLTETVPDDQWDQPCADEERAIGVVTHHVAASGPTTYGAVEIVLSGQELPAITWDQIHQMNAEHAVENASVTKAETIDLLASNSAQIVDRIESLTDDQLD